MSDAATWYAVLRLIPWSAVVVGGEPLRNPKPEPGEPEAMIPAFRTKEAALAWCEDGDGITTFLATAKEVTDG